MEIDDVADRYDENWREYKRYMSEADPDVLETWQPIIWGCMLKEPLGDFMIRFNWDKPEGEEMIVPPCGEMPREIMLICYHAKRLNPDFIHMEMPVDAKEQYRKRRAELLYKQDALSVIELLEVEL